MAGEVRYQFLGIACVQLDADGDPVVLAHTGSIVGNASRPGSSTLRIQLGAPLAPGFKLVGQVIVHDGSAFQTSVFSHHAVGNSYDIVFADAPLHAVEITVQLFAIKLV